jgi:LPXTG-motif cell wall-anchored protein
VGTVGREPATGGDDASMFSGIGFYLAVALILALVFVLVRFIG